MLASARQFCSEFIVDGKRPRWLSFVGNSGTGKTFISMMIYKLAKRTRLVDHETLVNGVHYAFWPDLLRKLREKQFHLLQDYRDANFLFLDEISIEHDPSGFGKDKLVELLCGRCLKWTLLTSNLTPEKLAVIDARIPSRMIRDGSTIIECKGLDWNLRSKR